MNKSYRSEHSNTNKHLSEFPHLEIIQAQNVKHYELVNYEEYCKRKKIILIDRFTDSTIAYQHYGMGVNVKIINIINKFLLKNIKVNFTFLNVVNKKNLFQRLKNRKSLNRYDQFDMNFYNKVQKGFLKLAKSNKKTYKIIDSNLDIKINEDLIINQIKKLIK